MAALQPLRAELVIGHAAGLGKWLPKAAWVRGIAVTHAVPVIAVAVGEMALARTLANLRHIPEHDTAFKARGTRGNRSIAPKLLATRSLHELRVGIVGASSTEREFLKLLRAYGAQPRRKASPPVCPRRKRIDLSAYRRASSLTAAPPIPYGRPEGATWEGGGHLTLAR